MSKKPSNPVIGNKVAHYLCKACAKQVYREGGFAVAGKHFKDKHPGEHMDVTIDVRAPQVPFMRRALVR